MRERNGVDSKRTEDRKELGEVERGETITRIYCVKKNLFSIQRKNKKEIKFYSIIFSNKKLLFKHSLQYSLSIKTRNTLCSSIINFRYSGNDHSESNTHCNI